MLYKTLEKAKQGPHDTAEALKNQDEHSDNWGDEGQVIHPGTYWSYSTWDTRSDSLVGRARIRGVGGDGRGEERMPEWRDIDFKKGVARENRV